MTGITNTCVTSGTTRRDRVGALWKHFPATMTCWLTSSGCSRTTPGSAVTTQLFHLKFLARHSKSASSTLTRTEILSSTGGKYGQPSRKTTCSSENSDRTSTHLKLALMIQKRMNISCCHRSYRSSLNKTLLWLPRRFRPWLMSSLLVIIEIREILSRVSKLSESGRCGLPGTGADIWKSKNLDASNTKDSTSSKTSGISTIWTETLWWRWLNSQRATPPWMQHWRSLTSCKLTWLTVLSSRRLKMGFYNTRRHKESSWIRFGYKWELTINLSLLLLSLSATQWLKRFLELRPMRNWSY